MSAAAPPLISVCILAGHDPTMLGACLDSLTAQEDPPPFELVIGATSAELAGLARSRFPDALVCQPPRGQPGWKRNTLVEGSRGELLLFLDDDVTVRPDLLRCLAELAERHPEASVFGGPNETPPHSSRFQSVQGAVLSSLVAAGPVSRRYGARHGGSADERWFTLCNLAVRRTAMVPFLQGLVCAEENAVLAQLRAHGEQMRYAPELQVFHERRSTWRAFTAQMLKYGRGRGQLLARRPATLRLAYLAPAMLLLYGLLAVILALLPMSVPALALLAPGAAYAGLMVAGALRVGLTLRSAPAVPIAAGLILTLHACYGLGVMIGVVLPGRGWRGERAASWGAAARGTRPERALP